MIIGKAITSWLEIILRERYGADFILSHSNSQWIISSPNQISRIEIDIYQPFYKLAKPTFGCSLWDPTKVGYKSPLNKALFTVGDNLEEIKFTEEEDCIKISFDILGLVYWCLNRCEEINRNDLDSHNRFPAKNSHAYQNEYLERPIVDEWLHVLGQTIKKVWPHVDLKKNHFSIQLSHDVDAPSQFAFVDTRRFIRRCGASILYDKNIKNALVAPWVRFKTKDKLFSFDGYNHFDWMMSLSEKYNLKSSFYFISGNTNIKRDADYRIQHPVIRNLMRQIHSRGHEIGLHPSYETYKDKNSISSEFNLLKTICNQEKIHQEKYGGRMHYLRWEHPYTLQAWNDAGLAYDSTLTYADSAGFRCGTCFEYPAFNPVTQTILDIRIRPLIAMECSIMDSNYMALGSGERAKNKFLELAEKCRLVGGNFTMLWHNSEFSCKNKMNLYDSLLKELHLDSGCSYN